MKKFHRLDMAKELRKINHTIPQQHITRYNVYRKDTCYHETPKQLTQKPEIDR